MMKKEFGRPPMLIIRSSHVAHLESFVNSKHTPYKYSFPLRNTFFIGVGGTKWETCLRHFQGLDLTTKNKHLGNQWHKFYRSGIKPRYTLVVLGGNSVDDYDKIVRKLKKKYKPGSKEFWKEAKKEQKEKLETLKPKIREVMYTIKNNAPFSELLYLQIIPRSWWHPLSRELARKVDKHVIFGLKPRIRVKDIRASLLFEKKKFDADLSPMPGMLDTDEVHMNGYGHRAFIRSVIGPITHKWVNFKKPKAGRK